MFVIGLTGGIGSGKSTVAWMLEELGAVVISADQVGHEVYKACDSARFEVVRAFGKEVIGRDGEIDRQALGAKVFSSTEQRRRLEKIVHPRMTRIMERRIGQLGEQGARVVALDAALLFEAGWDSLVDQVWVVTAPEEEAIKRLKQRTGLSDDDIRKRMGSQMPSQEKRRRADVVVENDGTLEELRSQMQTLWERVVKERTL